MKNVKLEKLSLENFKGIKSMEINFSETTKIYGDNATGKTTLVDAFTWLLFGKDSSDRKDFSIKTFDTQNKAIHKLDHEVTGFFDVDGEGIILRRVYREKWVTRRGSNEPELQGHETLFYWNDVPMQAGEYQSKVDEIINEQTFRMITNPMYFNSLKWQERRNILTTIAGNVSDADIAATRSDFQHLMAEMGSKTLDEYKKQLAAQKKKLKDELALIPARVDEVSRNTPEAREWKIIQDEIDILNNQIEAIDNQMADASKSYEAYYAVKQQRLSKINELKTKISDIEFKGRQAFNNQINEKQSTIDAAKKEIDRLNKAKANSSTEIDELNKNIELFKAEQSKLREEWQKVNEEPFQGIHADDCKCFACGQELQPDKVQAKQSEALARFNSNKERRLSAIVDEGKSYLPRIDNLERQISNIQNVSYDDLIGKQEEVIRNWESKKIESVQAILSDNQEYHQALKQLQEIESTPEQEFAPADNSELKLKKSGLSSRIDELKRQLATKEQIEQANKRKEELLRQEKEFSKQLAGLEKVEFTIAEFTRAKVDILESKINTMFTAVQFRLFDTQLNGGLVECCDTLVNTNGAWVPWSDGNSAGRINAGIEIINVLSAYYNQSAPIWIDNSESITSIKPTQAQRIEHYVSESDKSLRIAS